MKITVSCVQLLPRLGDKQYNLEKMRSWVETVMTQYPKTQLIVFPELMTSGYEGTPEMFQELAETLPDGESMRLMGELARKHHVHIVYGFPERDPVARSIPLPTRRDGAAPAAASRSLTQRSASLAS